MINPLTGEHLPIIVDDQVDMALGTGAVKITPSHDTSDFEMAKRNGRLPLVKLAIDDNGLMCEHLLSAEFARVPRFEARERVLAKLSELGMFVGKSEHTMTLPTCSRTGDVLETMLKEQWFVRAARVFGVCEEAVHSGQLTLVPASRHKLWSNYVASFLTRDWCISRQLWWGQRLPVYKCAFVHSPEQQHKWIAACSRQEAVLKARAHFGLAAANHDTVELSVEQDEDVLDTWFSSTLLPLAVLNSNSRSTIYPSDLLETGFDIMFFWVLRMVGMCHKLSGELPFRRILFHGLLRDSEGRKMSKSIGNVIDPMDLIDGVSGDEMRRRVEASNLAEKEKRASIQHQTKAFPNGIDAIGSDAMRLALLNQDFQCMLSFYYHICIF